MTVPLRRQPPPPPGSVKTYSFFFLYKNILNSSQYQKTLWNLTNDRKKGGGGVNMLWADLTLRSVMIRCKICILDVVTRCAENMSSAWLVNFVATRIVSCERREIDAFMQVKRRGKRQRNYFWSDFSHGPFFFFVGSDHYAFY